MYYLVSADTDLTAKPKRLSSWHFSATADSVIALRNGSVTGDIVVPIQLKAGTSASQAYSSPEYLIFPIGLFVDIVSGTVSGSVDLL